MKFGDNFHQLSIPEWKSYNLDYNGLKYQIRNITQSNSSDLSQLHSAFIENFDYINLFIKTKFGELTRKFDHLQNQFNQLIKNINNYKNNHNHNTPSTMNNYNRLWSSIWMIYSINASNYL